ncbi:MAG: type II toxin-antitoxin system RelE/ParE family toxin [Candidatus Wallbacteria bacterium]|nr:type II toxin-antitoxin system RelE/ParE family toxin [Candidatus Wallbacteria bacterium]
MLYSVIVGKRIILLHAFLKKTGKTPDKEINRASRNFEEFISREADL